MDKRGKWMGLLGSALIATVLGSALSMLLIESLALIAPFGTVLGTCAALSALCSLLLFDKKGALLASALIAAGAIWLVGFSGLQPFEQIVGLFKALMGLGTGDSAALAEYATAAALLIGGVLTLTIFWMARMSGGVYPALTLSLIVMLGSWFIESRIEPRYALMIVAGLATMFARAADEKVPYLRAAPAAILTALLAVMLLPAGNLTWAPLEEAARKARDLFSDYFLFTEPRTTYSISADGFQSMGDLLGGPADPSTAEVMAVETSETLLLRGSIKRTYTTYSWTESAVNSRYVFIDPIRRALRDEVFDADRTEGLARSGAFKPINAKVTMLSNSISTLFVPHRMTDFSAALSLVTYFSTSGEVFITRGVQPGDQYELSALVPTGHVAATRALLEAQAERDDPRYAAAKSAYTTLPQGIEQGVYQLAQKLTEDVRAPYDKALAIQDYLMANYEYSLEVPYPPQNRDFVSHFLLDGKEGYCSYFASAMAVMARMAGLPARYVEGYLVPARAEGVTIVTGKNAHAWVEIYFEGLGWISFNPTPGSGDSWEPPAGGGSESGGGTRPTPPPSDADAEEQPPEETPEPEEAPPEETTSDEPDPQDASEEEPPEEEPPEETPPEDEPPEDEPERAFPNLWPWLIALALLALCALTYKRLRDTDPRRVAERGKQAERLMLWYRALLLVLEQQGQVPATQETPVQFAERLVHAKLAGEPFLTVSRQVALTSYAGRKPESSVFRQARLAYDQLTRQLRPVERLRWLAHRAMQGLGDVKRIP